ncbi:hypothetical protein NU688_29920 [Variovorax sp. ZS18.2.2]|uniref:hypothetical protein n=1 Tax=Variovorax sp. ZS18.2.2 TaxID=2971255 RepID=UPI0021517EBC|nr:hypothetical protein [Variovorax sp. ZS18.2.2]MCR6480407.1 hypothetical protein [Variovorax sp. ZS18.2.2]
MRIFQTTFIVEVIILAAAVLLASTAAAEVRLGFEAPPPAYDPCRDGRYSYGRAMSCDELLQQLDHAEGARRLRFRDADRRIDDPCRDGRYSTGRAMTCGELHERLGHRERRRYAP